MSNTELSAALVAKMKSREGKNRYTQTSKRELVAEGYSDCSSLTHWVFREVAGVDIGDDTVGQILTQRLKTIPVAITDGIPRESDLLPGDLLFFRGRNLERKKAFYVGHVEMYEGGGRCIGHGSGLGPVSKDMAAYCRKRQASDSPVPPGNRGLICVRRLASLEAANPKEEEKGEAGKGQEATVRLFQAWLNEYLGAALELDGRLGPATRRTAVMAMQQYLNRRDDAGLELDGRFGPRTRAAYRTVFRGERGDHVRIVQGLLYGRGLSPEGFDGSCGGGCERAILAWQEQEGLEVDGRCGPATFRALVR